MAASMRWTGGFIAVDWGTTNRRAWLLRDDSRAAEEFEDEAGALSIHPGGFEDAVAEIRSKLGDKPLLMAGMIGSNRGWVEAPYVPCPAGLDELAAKLVWVETGKTAIVPGVCYLSEDRADVMRGEEVQILGALAADIVPPDCLVCHPGTHNKWVHLDDGRIVAFRTVMTGEMFSLLRSHSILSDFLEGEAVEGEAFRAGVRHGLQSGAVTADLFSVRARILLGDARREDAPSFTSGLLIGADLRVGLATAADLPIIVMGRPELTALYSAALNETGRRGIEVDGETAFLAGIRHIAELVE